MPIDCRDFFEIYRDLLGQRRKIGFRRLASGSGVAISRDLEAIGPVQEAWIWGIVARSS